MDSIWTNSPICSDKQMIIIELQNNLGNSLERKLWRHCGPNLLSKLILSIISSWENSVLNTSKDEIIQLHTNVFETFTLKDPAYTTAVTCWHVCNIQYEVANRNLPGEYQHNLRIFHQIQCIKSNLLMAPFDSSLSGN